MPKKSTRQRRAEEAQTNVTDLTVVGMKYLQEMQETFDGATDDIFDLINLQAAINHFQKEVDAEIEDRKADMKCKGMKELWEAILVEGLYTKREFIIEHCIDDVPLAYFWNMLEEANEYQSMGHTSMGNPLVQALAKADITNWTFKMEEFKDWQTSVRNILNVALDDAMNLGNGESGD